MIRINLLGIPKTRRGGKRAAAPSVSSGDGPNIVLVGFLMFLLAAGVCWYFYHAALATKDRLNADLQKATIENQRLAIVKANYEQNKAKADQFEQRVKVINQLRAQQAGPLNLMNLVAETVNSTDAVWLDAMTDDGRSIDFTGMALSPNSVADLMANLQKTGAFKSVEIKETAQDSQMRELQAFKFELICEKAAEQKKS
ncbi:MAG TPA: PilN domain-containing protein [Candidatus Angelobacter sp.]|nr:PilN domain-containing protein [Candidatus Angelobacter sp.]